MKPKFNLKVKKPSTRDEANVARKKTNLRNKQIEEAVKFCKENGVKGQAALNTGNFPLIKDRETINRRLDGSIKTGKLTFQG